jgi:hypothetical protein
VQGQALSRHGERLADLDGLRRGHHRAGSRIGVEKQLDGTVDTPHEHRARPAAVLAGAPGIDGLPVGLAGVLETHRSLQRAQNIQIRSGGSSCRLTTINSRYPQRVT